MQNDQENEAPERIEPLPGYAQPYLGVPFYIEALFTLGAFAVVDRVSLYRASGHLLVVRWRFFEERVIRVAFEDIEALRMYKTPWAGVSLALGALAMLLGGALALAYPGLVVVGALIAAVGGVVAIGNLALGAVWRVELHTALGPVRLEPWSRWATAQEGMRALIPRIQSAQAALDSDGAADAPRAWRPNPVPAPYWRRAGLAREPGGWHAAAFAILAGMAAVCGLFLIFPGPALYLVLLAMSLVALIAFIAALTRQRRSLAPAGLRALTGAGVVVLVLFYTLMALFDFGYAMAGGGAEWMTSIAFGAPGALRVVMPAGIALFGVVSLAGLLRLREYRRELAAMDTEAPPEAALD